MTWYKRYEGAPKTVGCMREHTLAQIAAFEETAMADERQARDAVLEAVRAYHAATAKSSRFVAGETYIPASGKQVNSDDLSLLVESCLDQWFTAGRFARELEETLAKRMGREPTSLLVSSGSSANLLAVSCLGSPLLDQFKLRGSNRATRSSRWRPLSHDRESDCPEWLDPGLRRRGPGDAERHAETVMAARTEKTCAVVLAHTLGNAYRADLLADWCRKEGLYLIEDCCDALGTRSAESPPVRSATTRRLVLSRPSHHDGEGGAVTARDGRLRRVAESLRDWGRDCWCEPGHDNTCKKRFEWQLGTLPCGYDHKYTYSSVGYNLKVTDMQAALGVSQLKRADEFIARRRANWKKLAEGLSASPVLSKKFRAVRATPGTDPSWFGFPLTATRASIAKSSRPFSSRRRWERGSCSLETSRGSPPTRT